MNMRPYLRGPLCVVVAATVLAGCGQPAATGTFVPRLSPAALSPISEQAQTASIVFPNAVPPKCKGQQTAKDHATDVETLSTKGGQICIPAFGKLGGTVSYPPANPSVGITLISSTTNYNGQLPALHSGKPIFYLQLATTGATNFGPNVKAGGGLTGAPITASKTYTVYGQAKISGFPVNFTPCYAIATKGTFGGVIGGIGTLLKGQNVPAAATGVIEIYHGKSANTKC